MNIAIIPARAGSKRIADKNIRLFASAPMLSWAIKNAQNAGIFDRIIVSTDSAEIKKVAIKYGAEVPYERPAELADDYTGTVPVIKHAVETLELTGLSSTYVCCIYPATPLLCFKDLIKGLHNLKRTNAKFSYGVTAYRHPIQRAVKIDEEGLLKINDQDMSGARTQDLECMYHDAGQFYWASPQTWVNQATILGATASGVIIPNYRAIDIDTMEDWKFAELVFLALNTNLGGFNE